MPEFLSPLEVEYVDGRFWKVAAPFSYRIGSLDSPIFVDVETGFITDFASIPKILWNILPPTGTYGKAAVIHDKMYKDGSIYVDLPPSATYPLPIEKAYADNVFLEAMKTLGTSFITRYTIWAGVRAGGAAPWNAYRRQSATKPLTP